MRRASAELIRASISGVSGGSRPSSGSTMIDVRRSGTTDVPRSIQKLL